MLEGLQKRRIVINAVMSVVQVIVLSGILFILYRFLLKTIGLDKLGTWSIVLATTSVAGIGNLGLSASVVKFVAKYLAHSQEETTAKIIQTAAISMSAFVGFLIMVAYPFAGWLLSLVMPSESLKGALSILPYALISFWIITVANVFQAALDGYQRIDIRSLIIIVSAFFHLLLSFFLVPSYGLMGLAYARTIQAIGLLVASWAVLKRFVPALPVFPCQWNLRLFREMIGYGINFQLISITQMLCDPATKALLTKFGGLTMVGLYEMASRMILHLRALLVTANQVLVPAIAHLKEKDTNAIQNMYKNNCRIIVYMAVPFYSIIIAFTPIISEIWIGQHESIFIIFSILLAVNLFVNTLSLPAYFSYLGIGVLKWNTLGHVVPSLMNVGLAFALGYFIGGIGVVIAWIISSSIGSILITLSYHLSYEIPLNELMPFQDRRIGLSCLLGIFTTFVLYYQLNHHLDFVVLSTMLIFSFFAIVIPFIWIHPIRKRLIGWIVDDMLNAKVRP